MSEFSGFVILELYIFASRESNRAKMWPITAEVLGSVRRHL
jgi:hypothetical protein